MFWENNGDKIKSIFGQNLIVNTPSYNF